MSPNNAVRSRLNILLEGQTITTAVSLLVDDKEDRKRRARRAGPLDYFKALGDLASALTFGDAVCYDAGLRNQQPGPVTDLLARLEGVVRNDDRQPILTPLQSTTDPRKLLLAPPPSMLEDFDNLVRVFDDAWGRESTLYASKAQRELVWNSHLLGDLSRHLRDHEGLCETWNRKCDLKRSSKNNFVI